jgi:ABC-type enterochelin transport system substrate-binding protein
MTYKELNRVSMTAQSEYQLENELIAQLKAWDLATVVIKDEANYCLTSKHKLNVPTDLHHFQKLNGSRSLAF